MLRLVEATAIIAVGAVAIVTACGDFVDISTPGAADAGPNDAPPADGGPVADAAVAADSEPSGDAGVDADADGGAACSVPVREPFDQMPHSSSWSSSSSPSGTFDGGVVSFAYSGTGNPDDKYLHLTLPPSCDVELSLRYRYNAGSASSFAFARLYFRGEPGPPPVALRLELAEIAGTGIEAQPGTFHDLRVKVSATTGAVEVAPEGSSAFAAIAAGNGLPFAVRFGIAGVAGLATAEDIGLELDHIDLACCPVK